MVSEDSSSDSNGDVDRDESVMSVCTEGKFLLVLSCYSLNLRFEPVSTFLRELASFRCVCVTRRLKGLKRARRTFLPVVTCPQVLAMMMMLADP